MHGGRLSVPTEIISNTLLMMSYEISAEDWRLSSVERISSQFSRLEWLAKRILIHILDVINVLLSCHEYLLAVDLTARTSTLGSVAIAEPHARYASIPFFTKSLFSLNLYILNPSRTFYWPFLGCIRLFKTIFLI